MIKYLELALSQEVYEYLEELDEMNWSARGNVLNQYLRNTSIGTTVRVELHCKLQEKLHRVTWPLNHRNVIIGSFKSQKDQNNNIM